MDANFKAKWVEALRSGEYHQGRKQLRNADDSFCCLGVLCDLVDDKKWIESGTGGYRYHGIEYSPLSFPPEEIRREVGLSLDVQNTVAAMNDEGNSFAEIADYIETNL